MTIKDIRGWQEKQATEEGPLTKYNEVLYMENKALSNEREARQMLHKLASMKRSTASCTL